MARSQIELESKVAMPLKYTAVVEQDGEWWIGWIEEVPGVNCQEATREELIESLRITLKEALELTEPGAHRPSRVHLH